ncbi:MAG: TonB-dependent receptor [Acidobacteria bacterium]|nr:TonB-dependent receptor [Acidobacteriota bacterium]
MKSGSNAFHGAAFGYHQNRNLNAIDEQFKRAGFRNKAPRFDSNRIGGNIGGPILRDKAFFFFNYDYSPTGQASTAKGAIFVPTADGIRILDGLQGISKANLDQFKRWVPAAATATANRFTSVRGVQIPLGALSVTGPSFENIHSYTANGDYNLSERDQIRVRYLHRRIDSIDTAADLPAFFSPVQERAHLASVSHFHTFSPRVTNELRLAYTRRVADFPLDAYSYPGLDAFPNLTMADLGINIGPNQNFPQSDAANSFQLIENLSWIKGAHTLKMGYDGRKLNRSSFFVQRARGDYIYQTFERFLNDITPEFAQRSVGGFPFAGNLLSHYLYINDDWKIKPNVTLNLGLRYEFVDVPAGAKLQRLNSVASVPQFPIGEPLPTKRDFAPRVGLAWSPGNDGRTSVRAGFGLGYDQVYQNLGTVSLPPQFFSTVDAHITRANGSNFLGAGGVQNIAAPVTDPATARRLTSSYIPDQTRPYSIQWTLGVQRVFAQDYTAEVRYLGSRGIHLPFQIQPNRAAAVTAASGSVLPTYLQRPSQGEVDGLRTSLADLLTFNTNTLAAQGFASTITAFYPLGNSSYHGLAAQLTRRFSRGLQMNLAYTWSHNIDDSTAALNSTVLTPRRPQDFFNLRPERADSALDRRHRMTIAWIYDTPWFKDGNWMKKNLLGNWTFTGIYTAETGAWGTVRSGVDSNFNGDNAGDRTIVNPSGNPLLASGVRALCRGGGTCDPAVGADRARIVGWVADDPNARYILAGQGSFPNAGRNTLRLPGINNFDVNFGKRISVTERHAVEFRLETYNLLNNSQYTPGFPNTAAARSRTTASATNLLLAGTQGASSRPSVANAVFMRPDLAFQSNSRTLQLVLRYTF